MSTRVNPFATLAEPPVFTTKPKADKPVEQEVIARIAEENNFPSRQAPKPPKEPTPQAPRLHDRPQPAIQHQGDEPKPSSGSTRLADERQCAAGRVARTGA